MYKITESGHQFPASELAAQFPNVSLPSVLTQADLDHLGIQVVPDPAPTPEDLAARFASARSAAVLRIDADTDGIYGAILGNRSEEYSLAATEAQAYKVAGYAGPVPGSVQSWATAKGWTTTQATDDILTTAAQWIGAQAAIRAARLLRKEQVRNASDAAGINTAMTAWAGFANYIRGQLGV